MIKQLLFQKMWQIFLLYMNTRYKHWFTFKNSFFGFVKLIKSADPGKYKYSAYSIGFDLHSFYLLPNNTTRRSVVIFGADLNSSVHIHKKGKIS